MRLKNRLSAILLSSWLPVVMAASDDALTQEQGLALAKRSVCLACHQVKSKRVGPAFVQIAERYEQDESAVQKLVQAIHDGSRNQWGVVPMPPQRHVSEANARQLALWILRQKP